MNKLRFAWVVSLIAMLGSLYFSEIKNFIPCAFCWYQRILMYPLVFFMGVNLIRNDEKEKMPYYVLPMSILGMMISGFHYMMQKVPYFQKIEVCTTGIPCSGMYINWLGFITIPFLAFTAFTLITITMVLMLKEKSKN